MGDEHQPVSASDAFRRQLKASRIRAGLSQEELSRRLGELGTDLHSTAITRIEKGTRKAALDEVIAMACALDGAPVHFLVPIESGEPYAVTPTITVPADQARAWFRGEHPLPFNDPRTYFSTVPREDFHPPKPDPADIETTGKRRVATRTAHEKVSKAIAPARTSRRSGGTRDGQR